jgi:hypothetical protein
MRLLTRDAVLKCGHGGVVGLDPRQHWVTVAGRALLVESDPLGRRIEHCPQATPTTPPCLHTISVDEGASYSAFIRIDGRRICLDRTTGHTDWAMLTTASYSVTAPGQAFVESGA